MSKIKIIITEDHSMVREGIKLMLNTLENIEIVGDFPNGKELIDFLEKDNNVDIILMDLSMPIMNGIDTTRIIKEKYKKIKIIAITMHDEQSFIIDMYKSGADGYVLKESGSEDLLKAIETVTQGKSYFTNDVSIKLINSLANNLIEPQKQLISSRESEIIRLVSRGLKNKQIAEKLCLSARTVESHRRNILNRLNLKNTAEMINYAIKEGIVN